MYVCAGYSPQAMGDSVDNYINATESDIMIKRQIIRAEFYNTYDVMTGVRISIRAIGNKLNITILFALRYMRIFKKNIDRSFCVYILD